MKPIINIEAFRQYYEEAVNCKTVLNTNAENLSLDDERRLDALLPIYDEHGREMVKRLIVNAIRQDSQNYSEQVRKWADNAVVAMFIYETDNVLSDYIPDYLSEAAIEAVTKDLMEREKQKTIVKSKEGTEYEVIKSEESNCLLCKHTDGIPIRHMLIRLRWIGQTSLFVKNSMKNISISKKQWYRKVRLMYLNRVIK